MRFLKISLENWKNFKHIEVSLQNRVFLVGPNASGKSNFLDAFRFLKDLVSTGGGLEEAVNKRLGVSQIRCLAATRSSDISLKVELGDDESKPEWSYHLVFGQDNHSRPLVKEEIVHSYSKREKVLKRPDKYDHDDEERLHYTNLEQTTANREFREIAEFFNSVDYLHVVPQLVREPERSVGKVNDPYGGDFLEQIAQTQKKTQESRLKKICKALKVAAPQLAELNLERDKRDGTPHLVGRYEHWRPKAGWQKEQLFSDGTLRLFGLLWAVLDGKGPLLIEEPELSLHPAVIRHIPQVLARVARTKKEKRRQIILSSHSNDLLQDTGIALDEVLLLSPSKDGTEVNLATNIQNIRELLKGGFGLGEIVIPQTAPKNADQLALFGGSK